MSNEQIHLPVIENPSEEREEPSCSPKIYVSNEEAALLTTMRELHEASVMVRGQLKTAEANERPGLEAELQDLRAKRRDAAKKREKAYIRKMIMLGHLPPDFPIEP